MPEVAAMPRDTSQSLPAISSRQIGRYTPLAKLATGGMAEIFLARQRGVQGFEKLVVVKRILAFYSEDPELVTMFLEEGRLPRPLRRPERSPRRPRLARLLAPVPSRPPLPTPPGLRPARRPHRDRGGGRPAGAS